jgi:methyl-accepting chemotaxis protein
MTNGDDMKTIEPEITDQEIVMEVLDEDEAVLIDEQEESDTPGGDDGDGGDGNGKPVKKNGKKKKNRDNYSLHIKIGLIVSMCVILMWAGVSVPFNYFLVGQIAKYSAELQVERLNDIYQVVLIDELQMAFEDEDADMDTSGIYLEEYITGFRAGESGFAGVLYEDQSLNMIGGDSSMQDEIVAMVQASWERRSFGAEKQKVLRIDNYIICWDEYDSGNAVFIAFNVMELSAGFRLFMIIANVIFTVLGILFVVVLSVLILHGIIVKPLKVLISKTVTIKEGDLTTVFAEKRKDEFGHLAAAFNDTLNTLKALIQKIYVVIIIMSKNLRILFKSSSAVSESANEQAVTVEQTLSNFESMNTMIETISNESAKANNYTVQALEKARVGMESMQKLESEMGKIESSSLEITDIIGMINDIAEQTNLLSLNASIESARAGEAGKGFNIVAGEVRKLAEKSTTAANRIQTLIVNNNKIIKEGVSYSKQTTTILKEIALSNELITGLVKTITEEVQKVSHSSGEMLSAFNQISEIAQANLTESEHVNNAMEDFVEQTIELQKFVGQFDVRSEEIKENQKHIEEILRAKLNEVDNILREYGTSFLPTGTQVTIGGYDIQELQLGNIVVTGNVDLVDAISRQTNTSVTIFQTVEDSLLRVATTVRNYDNSRAIGTSIGSESQVYQTVMARNVYYGRAFVVNRWYVAVYRPIIDETGYILGVLYLGLPEEMEVSNMEIEAKDALADDGIVKDDTFRHEF